MFSGSICALITPFRNGEVDEKAFAGLKRGVTIDGVAYGQIEVTIDRASRTRDAPRDAASPLARSAVGEARRRSSSVATRPRSAGLGMCTAPPRASATRQSASTSPLPWTTSRMCRDEVASLARSNGNHNARPDHVFVWREGGGIS